MIMQRLTVINLFAGPGAGKSTVAAGVFYQLKLRGVRVELVTETAKDATYENHEFLLNQQVFLFADQLRRQTRLKGQREVIVTDSPILLPALVYNDKWDSLPGIAWEAWRDFDNMSFYIKRPTTYDTEGRRESLAQAVDKDSLTKSMLVSYGVPFEEISRCQHGIDHIVEKYLERRREHANV